MKKICLFLLISAMFYPAVLPAQPDIQGIIDKMDKLYRSKTSYSVMEMKIVTKNWERTLSMKGWSKGMKHTFIRILSPKKEKGVATLRVENEMWNFLPKAGKVIKIPPSMMMSSWMGSDFTNDDLVKESSMIDDYDYKLVNPEGEPDNLYYVELVPKENKPIVWGKIVLAVTKDEYLPVWEKYYDEKGRYMRLMNFKDVKTFSGKKIPSVMEILPQNKPENKTIVKYIELELDLPLDKDVFTMRNLRAKPE